MIEFTVDKATIEQRMEYRRASVRFAEVDSPAANGRTWFSIEITGPAEGCDGPFPEQLAEFERLARQLIREDVLQARIAKIQPNPPKPEIDLFA